MHDTPSAHSHHALGSLRRHPTRHPATSLRCHRTPDKLNSAHLPASASEQAAQKMKEAEEIVAELQAPAKKS